MPDELDREQTETDLRRLFDVVVPGFMPPPDDRRPFRALDWGEGSLCFIDDSLELLMQLERTLADHALTAGGRAVEAAGSLVARACIQARAVGVDQAIANFWDEYNAEPVTWIVALENRDLIQERDLPIGLCRIVREHPDNLPRERVDDYLTPPLIITEVVAHDRKSAEVIASDRFDEARAILSLADAQPLRPSGGRGVTVSEGMEATYSGQERLYAWNIINPEESGLRPLHPGYHELSEAAAQPREERTEWARRTLAAARWYHRSLTSRWYSEVVAAAMSALEVLLVGPGEASRPTIAERATVRGVLPDMSQGGQERWLKRMYDTRSGSLHGGSLMLDDLDADRLVDLTGHVCRWAVWHLNPFHRLQQASCETFDEVHFEPRAHPGTLRELREFDDGTTKRSRVRVDLVSGPANTPVCNDDTRVRPSNSGHHGCWSASMRRCKQPSASL